MRWGILGARAAIIAVNLIIALIIVLSILPMANGGLKVDIPQQDVDKPTIVDNVMSFSVPVKVYNGGYFDITDFRMHFVIGQEGERIAEYTSPPTNIVTGRTTTVNIAFSLDLSEIPDTVLQKMVFEQTELDIQVGVEASYSLGLVKASLRTNQTMNWDPLISNFLVDTTNVPVQPNGSAVDFMVPYSFNANSLITGTTVNLDTTLYYASNHTQVAYSSELVTIQPFNAGTFLFTVPQDVLVGGGDFIVGADLTYEGASLYREYSFHYAGGMP